MEVMCNEVEAEYNEAVMKRWLRLVAVTMNYLVLFKPKIVFLNLLIIEEIVKCWL